MTSNTLQPLSLHEQDTAERDTVSLDRLQNSELIAYRRLALQLHHDMKHGTVSRSVMLVSPDDAGTCARVAANLACCMAEELGHRILLADSTREGMLSSALTGAVESGLNNFLSNPSLPLDTLVLPTSFRHVAFLPCGSRSSGYSPDNASKLLDAATEQYDFVVVAAGALLTDPFALASAPVFGAVLLLVVENQTPTKAFREAAHSLQMCGVETIRLTVVQPIHP